jgi:hypothetical protein
MNITDPINQILKHLPNKQAAIDLLTHARNRLLIMEGGAFHFCDLSKKNRNGQPGLLVQLTGLTRVLSDFYWPDRKLWYQNNSALAKQIKRAHNTHKCINKKKQAQRKKLQSMDAQAAATSHVRGSIVHRQVGNWFHMTKDQFNVHNMGGAHPQTELVFEALEKESQILLSTEFRVACTEIGLGSAIDFVSVDARTGKLRFTELKTVPVRVSAALFALDNPTVEYSGLLHKSSLERNICAHAKLQLAICVLMLVEGMSFPHDFDTSVLLVWDDGYQWIDVDADFYRDYAGPVYADLKEKIPEWRKEQRALAVARTHQRKIQREMNHNNPPRVQQMDDSFDEEDIDTDE